MRELSVAFVVLVTVASCKVEVGVESERVEAKIQRSFALQGLELADVSCPDGRLNGKVQCAGTTADGARVPLELDIKTGFLKQELEYETRGVSIGPVVARHVAESSKEKYGVELKVTCPSVVPEDQPMTCTGTFDGADFVAEYKAGSWNTTSGIVSADSLEETLRNVAAKQKMDIDPASIDCGPQRVYGAKTGRKVSCRAGDRRVIFGLEPTTASVIGEEPISP